jgi:purine catabolism regulator
MITQGMGSSQVPERHGFAAARTDRPVTERATVLPTIRDVLRLEQVVSAVPEVVAGEEHLDRPVRWVHVSETADVTHLVQGGELILSTGVGWPTEPAELRAFASGLVDAAVAGVVLELGHRFVTVPDAFAAEARRLELPFVVLHGEARFVAVTEAVHSRIIADQMAALRARDEIHALFTQLSLRGSPGDFIVSQVGRTLGSPVVLEDLTHRVIAVEAMGRDAHVLRDWEQRSRQVHDRLATRDDGVRDNAAHAVDDWTIVPVEARGMRWGYLVALPGPPHPAGRTTVLEQAATALALSRLADHGADEWTRASHERLIGALLGRRFSSDRALADRLEASGLPVEGRTLVGLAARVHGSAKAAAGLASAVRELGAPTLSAAHPGEDASTVVVIASLARDGQLTDAVLLAFANALARAADAGPADVVVAVGAGADGVPGLLASVEQATDLLAPPGGKRHAPLVVRVQDRPLLRLLNAFGNDPRLQAHSERMLAPLIDHDLRRGGDLLDVLAAYLAYPGNRTRAATASHLSRSVFYQRIALIEDLLGVSLDDGEVVSALHAALLARRAAR